MAALDRRIRETQMSKIKVGLATSAVIVLSVVTGGLVMALPAQAATTAIAHYTGVEDGTNDGETADDNGVEDGTNDGETADDNGVEDGTNDGETADDNGVEDGTNDGETADDVGN
jgi:hypothetical protein